jgi:hypothetical protein
MYCGKCGKKIESTAGVCYSCASDPVFYGPVFPCPQCARFREKLDREKMAKQLWHMDAPRAGIATWIKFTPRLMEPYLKAADELIAYLTE